MVNDNASASATSQVSQKKAQSGLMSNLSFQMCLALIVGGVIGHFYPDIAVKLGPLSTAFLKLIKAVVGVVIFCTIVTGVVRIGREASVGRIGIKTLIYFEIITTVALAIGIILANVFEPGKGMGIDPATLDSSMIEALRSTAEHADTVSWLLSIIPTTFVSAFTHGDLLPILLMAILFGFSLMAIAERGEPVLAVLDATSDAMFKMVGMIMKLAPLAVLGAIAFSIGKYGVASALPMLKLATLFYVSCIVFIGVVLGSVCIWLRISLWKLIRYLKVELLLAAATASSESVLPAIVKRLEHLGCRKDIVGFVIPAGFSFNLVGSSIYFTMAVVFIAQACNIDLTWSQELTLLLVFIVTSKGVAGVAGSGMVTFVATLTIVPDVPVAGIALLLGIDRFLDSMQTPTNLLGNAIATILIADSEEALDRSKMEQVLAGQS